MVPVHHADGLNGVEIDLFVNIISIAEMHDRDIKKWFSKIQQKTKTNYAFLLNVILTKGNLLQKDYLTWGDWTTRFDPDWDVLDFEIPSKIHTCPLIVAFSITMSVLAKRRHGPRPEAECAAEANRLLRELAYQDWVSLSVEEQPGDRERAKHFDGESTLGGATYGRAIDESTAFDISRYQTQLFYPNSIVLLAFDGGVTGAFFALWNVECHSAAQVAPRHSSHASLFANSLQRHQPDGPDQGGVLLRPLDAGPLRPR
jgi:hypothetical protein